MNTAVIIGGGPAGCQCALWLHMLGYKVSIIELSSSLGGLQLSSPYSNNWIAGFTGLQGKDIGINMNKHLNEMNIPIYYNANIKKIIKTEKGFQLILNSDLICASNIVIATGVKPKTGGVALSRNVLIGPGKNVADFSFAGQRVAIFGGGDNAAENYWFIKEKEPAICHVYARSVRARHNLWEKVDPRDAFLGEYFINNQDSKEVAYKKTIREYDVFLVLYGWEANIPAVFDSIRNLILDDQGFISTDCFKRTNIENIFAIGEVAHCLYPCVITAMAEGVIAAKIIQSQQAERLSKNLR